MYRFAFAIGLSLVTNPVWAADEFPVLVYPVQRTGTAPELDGRFDEPFWSEAPLVSGFTLHRIKRLGMPQAQTSFRVLYDDQYLYFGVTCREAHIDRLRAQGRVRDDPELFADDVVELFVDPHHSHEIYYQFAVNSQGVFYDGMKVQSTWNGRARVAVHIAQGAWSVELAIPWPDLGIEKPVNAMVVGFNVCRHRNLGTREYSNWSQTRKNFHDVARYAHLVLTPSNQASEILEAQVRKGDRHGPIRLFDHNGYSGSSYAALGREAMQNLDRLLLALRSTIGDQESEQVRQELQKSLEAIEARIGPYRQRLVDERLLGAVAWARLSARLSDIEKQFPDVVWKARLAALLTRI